jgi:hypothetical protein
MRVRSVLRKRGLVCYDLEFVRSLEVSSFFFDAKMDAGVIIFLVFLIIIVVAIILVVYYLNRSNTVTLSLTSTNMIWYAPTSQAFVIPYDAMTLFPFQTVAAVTTTNVESLPTVYWQFQQPTVTPDVVTIVNGFFGTIVTPSVVSGAFYPLNLTGAAPTTNDYFHRTFTNIDTTAGTADFTLNWYVDKTYNVTINPGGNLVLVKGPAVTFRAYYAGLPTQ